MHITPHLMFENAVADVIAFWQTAFPEMLVEPDVTDENGRATRAVVTIAGQRIILFDSPASHDFSLTPATSLFVVCDNAEDVDRLTAILSEGGKALMPLDAYDFSPRFAWIEDRFGVNWQLILPPS